MNKIKIDGHTDSGRTLYSKSTVKLIREEAAIARATVLEMHKLGLYGSEWFHAATRFNDTDRLVAALESGVSEAEFNSDYKHCMIAALEGLADCDYYYQYEKNYGTKDLEQETEED